MEKTTDAMGFGKRLKMISTVASLVTTKGKMMDSCGPSCQWRISSPPKERSIEIEMKGPREPRFERLEPPVAPPPRGEEQWRRRGLRSCSRSWRRRTAPILSQP
ncbi:unnamed protein product [Linum trigynum]|uniref:Uncharacterized protein n=1 Tax=Linum trigynum TaxID=586398 RepID=A0AAV2CDN0_9ROSI